MLILTIITLPFLLMPPFEEEGVYCFANVGWSVLLVCRSVDQMVSADYLKYHSLQSFSEYRGWS